jgi:hypothetical protein
MKDAFAEAAKLEGAECKGQWFGLDHAQGMVSKAAKRTNTVARFLFNWYAKGGESFKSRIIPYSNQAETNNFCCLGVLYNSAGDRSTVKFGCPWDYGQFNDISNDKDMHSMLKCLVDAWFNTFDASSAESKEFVRLTKLILDSNGPTRKQKNGTGRVGSGAQGMLWYESNETLLLR